MEQQLLISFPNKKPLYKKWFKWIFHNTSIITFLLLGLLFISLYDVLAYNEILPAISRSNNWDRILYDIILSIIIGLILYFFTSVFPRWQKAKQEIKNVEATLAGPFFNNCWELSTILNRIDPKFTFMENSLYKFLDINCLLLSNKEIKWNKAISVFDEVKVKGITALDIVLRELQNSAQSIYYKQYDYLNKKEAQGLKDIIESDIYNIIQFNLQNEKKDNDSNSSEKSSIGDFNKRIIPELRCLYESIYSIYGGLYCNFGKIKSNKL